jgi:hypothetical protein
MGESYMNRRDEKRSGYASGVSVLSSERSTRPFSTPDVASFPRGKGRVRPDQDMTPSGPAPGAVPVHGAPGGRPVAPSIGPGESGFGGPGSKGRNDKRRGWW